MYWNHLYDDEGSAASEEAVTEWHVDGQAMLAPLERLLPTDKELSILNVGCGTSMLWARCVLNEEFW